MDSKTMRAARTGKDSARGLVQGRQEMRCRVLACAAARMVLLSIAMTLRPAMVPVRVQNQGSHMSVEIHGGQVLEHPPDGRLRRKILSHLKAHGPPGRRRSGR